MPTLTPHPATADPPGILDLSASLLVTVPTDQPCSFTPTNLPPLPFLLLADRLGELYEMVFPDHPEWLDEQMVDWEDEEDVAAAAELFLGRVNTLFPVHDDIWDIDIEVVEWRLYEIPVIPMGFDLWYDGWDEFKEPASYILHASWSRSDEDTPDERDEFASLYPDHRLPRYLEPRRLTDTLRQICAERSRSMDLPGPLSALPDLIAMLHHETGNAWLDVGEISLMEGGGYPQWSREDIDWLAAEWQKAKPLLDRIHQLLDWQNEDPEAVTLKLTAVRQALLDAYQIAQDSTETIITTEVVS